jgi:hypothetical protein
MTFCETCANRRDPDDLEWRKGGGQATTPAERQVMLKRRRELESDLVLENASVAEHGGNVRRRPIANAWCSARSDDRNRRYYFCEWLGAQDCKFFSCIHRDEACNLCQGPPGFCLRQGGSSLSRSAPQESPQAASGWRLPLGDVFRLVMSRRSANQDNVEEGFELQYRLEPVNNKDRVYISGAGLCQTYLIFGGPGAGKTHFFKYLLSRILAHEVRPGCLVLDPKGVLPLWMSNVLERIGRKDDLAVVQAGSKWSCNVLGSALSPRELGRVLSDVVLSEAAGIDEGWQVFVSDLLESAAVVSAAARNQAHVTAADMLDDILTRHRYRRREGGVYSEYPVLQRAKKLRRSARERETVEACDRIVQFFASTEEKQRRFVRQLVERTLGELRTDPWRFLSDPEGGDDLYSTILGSGRVVLVSVGQGSPSFQRSLCTLMKAVFQQTVLSTLSATGGATQPARFSVLATDEYAQVVAEGQSGLVSDSRFFSLSREANCMSLLALQSIATARSRFHPTVRDRWEGVVGNVNVRVFMRLNDIETAKMGSSLGGSRHSLIKMIGTSISEASSGVSESFTVVENPRVPEWFLTNNLKQGQAFVHGTLDGKDSPVSCFISVPVEGDMTRPADGLATGPAADLPSRSLPLDDLAEADSE